MLILSASTSAQPDTTPATQDGKTLVFHQHRARAIIQGAYALERWRDPTPAKLAEKRAWQRHRLAIEIPKVRWGISFYRERMARRFERHRAKQLTVASVTPYDCGSYGDAAIPCYVVACESGFDWGAVNPSSGAFGWYQLLPSTYAGVCDHCDRSKIDQHEAADDVWARSGGSEWVCA